MAELSLILPKVMSAIDDMRRLRTAALNAVRLRYSSSEYTSYLTTCNICGHISESFNVRLCDASEIHLCSICTRSIGPVPSENTPEYPITIKLSMYANSITTRRGDILRTLAESCVYGSVISIGVKKVSKCCACDHAPTHTLTHGNMDAHICNDCYRNITVMLPWLSKRTALIYNVLKWLCTLLLSDLLPQLCICVAVVGTNAVIPRRPLIL